MISFILIAVVDPEGVWAEGDEEEDEGGDEFCPPGFEEDAELVEWFDFQVKTLGCGGG